MKELDQEIICEFLSESHENLSRLDQELVELEKHPNDTALLASVFRTLHTIKGTCGFLAFSTLEKISHHAESILSQLRDGKRDLTPALVSLVLQTVDAIRTVLSSIETTGLEGPNTFPELIERLQRAAQEVPVSTSVPITTELATVADDSAKLSAGDSSIRVPVALLDRLMDLVGELVLSRNQILQFNTDREDATLNTTSQRLNLITTELQEGVMKTRMQPIGTVWKKLPRVVRDISVALGKQVRLDMEGSGTELDRTIIESIKDPLVHLVRNACDHGIESAEVRAKSGKQAQGTLTLRAFHEGGQVNIEIADDGAGIDVARIRQKAAEMGLFRTGDRLSDREVLRFIFAPGFSMAQAVTNLSGRGVGMDVVRSNIEKIGGIVDVFSRLGEGTTIKLKIPLTLAIIPGLFVTSGGERFAIAQVNLLELIRLDRDTLDKQIESVLGTPVYRRRGTLLPVADLNRVLGLKPGSDGESVSLVVLQAENRQFGLLVDSINDTQEIVVKPLGKQLKGLSVYAGATIMGDGRVALILDVLGIGQTSGVLMESQDQARAETDQKTVVGSDLQRLLLFRAGSFANLAVPLSIVSRLEEFPRSSLEQAGGRAVVQYRNGILPLVNLREVLEPGAPAPLLAADPVQVIVFSDLDRSLGLVVDQILDIAEETITVRQKTGRKGLLGSGVIGTQVADFLDLDYLFRAADEDWLRMGTGDGHGKTILVAEASPLSRGTIRGALEMAGYQVVEASSVAEAVRGLERQPVSVVIASLHLPPNGCAALQTAMRRRPDWEAIPILALGDTEEQVRVASAAGTYEDCQSKFDREAVVGSLVRLARAVGDEVAQDEPAAAGPAKGGR